MMELRKGGSPKDFYVDEHVDGIWKELFGPLTEHAAYVEYAKLYTPNGRILRIQNGAGGIPSTSARQDTMKR